MQKPFTPVASTLPLNDVGRGQTVAMGGDRSAAAFDATIGAIDATLSADTLAPATTPTISGSPLITRPSTCVLPQVRGDAESPHLVHEERVRYETIKVLGSGGMGEVSLAEDLDIGRKVAVKNLHAEMKSAPSLARFVEEIRTIGRLEHPNIVPIHDVGVNAKGDYFFVMKHVDGETLEHIIEKLQAGDPGYHAKYTTEARIEIMLGILRALQFAHDAGIIHRDVKPANVMVGRYGEVILMDWGIAKMITDRRKEYEDGTPEPKDERARLFSTRRGQLVGTPAYMSPEQARGDIDHIDARSDVYSAMVLFHEFVTLKHYLSEKPTVAAMIAGVVSEEPSFGALYLAQTPHQPLPPAEIAHLCSKGLLKDPKKRFQSADEVVYELGRILTGEIRVQCPFSAAKRMSRESGRLVDRHPFVAVGAMLASGGLMLVGAASTVLHFIH